MSGAWWNSTSQPQGAGVIQRSCPRRQHFLQTAQLHKTGRVKSGLALQKRTSHVRNEYQSKHLCRDETPDVTCTAYRPAFRSATHVTLASPCPRNLQSGYAPSLAVACSIHHTEESYAPSLRLRFRFARAVVLLVAGLLRRTAAYPLPPVLLASDVR